jgi:hypothetical protein
VSRDRRVLRLAGDVRHRVVGDEGVVLRQVAREVLVVNETGARVLSLIDGSRTLGGIADALAGERDAAPAVVARDVTTFADELLAAGVAELVRPAAE